jgi:hypothetical protein
MPVKAGFLLFKFISMAEQNRRSSDQRDNDQNQKRSGQETLGKRQQKADKKDVEHYRSSEQKKQRGNHGGNR